MTDNEIIKALECCYGGEVNCNECPMWEYEGDCFEGLMKHNALHLINRQKAEIDRCKIERDLLEMQLLTAKAELKRLQILRFEYDKDVSEAIKEFADKLKAKFDEHGVEYTAYTIVDDVMKEMGVSND